jgi:hypothetical protein
MKKDQELTQKLTQMDQDLEIMNIENQKLENEKNVLEDEITKL